MLATGFTVKMNRDHMKSEFTADMTSEIKLDVTLDIISDMA